MNDTHCKISAATLARTAALALALTNQEVVDALGGLPAHKLHCSVLAEQAIKAALSDYYRRQGIDPGPLVGEVHECEGCCEGH